MLETRKLLLGLRGTTVVRPPPFCLEKCKERRRHRTLWTLNEHIGHLGYK
jgi:hypothetical protein